MVVVDVQVDVRVGTLEALVCVEVGGGGVGIRVGIGVRIGVGVVARVEVEVGIHAMVMVKVGVGVELTQTLNEVPITMEDGKVFPMHTSPYPMPSTEPNP